MYRPSEIRHFGGNRIPQHYLDSIESSIDYVVRVKFNEAASFMPPAIKLRSIDTGLRIFTDLSKGVPQTTIICLR